TTTISINVLRQAAAGTIKPTVTLSIGTRVVDEYTGFELIVEARPLPRFGEVPTEVVLKPNQVHEALFQIDLQGSTDDFEILPDGKLPNGVGVEMLPGIRNGPPPLKIVTMRFIATNAAPGGIENVPFVVKTGNLETARAIVRVRVEGAPQPGFG